MNAKVEQQIAEMKKQTIGVEVEMNNITRKEAALLAATFFISGILLFSQPRPRVEVPKRCQHCRTRR